MILLCLQSPRKEELNEVCDGLSQTLSLTPQTLSQSPVLVQTSIQHGTVGTPGIHLGNKNRISQILGYQAPGLICVHSESGPSYHWAPIICQILFYKGHWYTKTQIQSTVTRLFGILLIIMISLVPRSSLPLCIFMMIKCHGDCKTNINKNVSTRRKLLHYRGDCKAQPREMTFSRSYTS